ncbi:hypothetical protein EDD72_102259 [Tepidibacillus fermentans]|uniref:Uncharacterized protein n=1 Tax=Tepidibacillus fermentans TaxID=1281767 RepID=A0A4R3KK94_9BACI|nr:hypothetical protein EDD72_102259 [Tepidibacillus fermentans]
MISESGIRWLGDSIIRTTEPAPKRPRMTWTEGFFSVIKEESGLD